MQDVDALDGQVPDALLVDGGDDAHEHGYRTERVPTALGCVPYLHNGQEPKPTQGELVHLNSLVVLEGVPQRSWAASSPPR